MADSENADKRTRSSRAGHRTSAARLAAVQALYEIDVTNAEPDAVVMEFLEKRWRAVTLRDPDITPGEGGKARLPNPDEGFLRDLVEGVRSNLTEIDAQIEDALEDEWSLERLDALMRTLMRASTFELIKLPSVPNYTVLSEYSDLAHTFFDEKEAKFAGGVLNKLAKLTRPE